MAEKDPNKKPHKFYKARNQIYVSYTQEQSDFIDQQSKAHGLSKSQYLRNLLQSAIDRQHNEEGANQ